ncbi:Isy1-like splicing factor [Atractiella rhizophila]|nr:Isy1-like splicing factor [Atractiella rhizophila]
MARNEEKAQSMLYRFREAQAAELGLITGQKYDRRPRMVSNCKDLRQAERWRGEVLRDISRKVSKIQDVGLTDYEVRDLNDEINKLLREKANWENQIIALGGANYKRAAQKTTDAEGREIPGMRGYKYFGRARDLPGVRELFESTAEHQRELESYKTGPKVDKFQTAASKPNYYGDVDENDAALREYESKREEEEWDAQFRQTAAELGIEEEIPAPKMKKIKILGGNTEFEVESVLEEEDLRPPKIISNEEFIAQIVEIQKQALMKEYLGS